MGSKTQPEHDRAVVLELIGLAKLDIDPETVESRPPPEPDVHGVSASEGPVYFELGRLLDQGIQKLRLEGFRRAWARDPTPVSMNDQFVGLPERDMLKQKLGKSYINNGVPIDLVLYYDAENALVAGGIPPIEFSEHAKHVMLPVLAVSSRSPFRRVWVLERFRPSVLWKYP